MTVWDVYTANRSGRRTGPLTVLDGSSFTIRHNAVGVWQLNLPWTDDAWDRVQPGSRVTIRRRGRSVCSGPITGRSWADTFEESSGSYASTITVLGVTNEIHLADRIVYPTPSSAGTVQADTASWSRNAPVETIMCDLVREQLGPSARTERRVEGLTVATSQGRGGTRAFSSRFALVLPELQGLAAAAGLGFRVAEQSDGTLLFEVYAPEDRTGAVRYGVDLGNVAEQEYRDSAPTGTYWLTGGGGEGVARVLRERTATDSTLTGWGRRIESFIDARDTTDLAELDGRLVEAEAEALPDRTYVLSPLDTANARLLDGVDLGDRVTVYAGPRASRRREKVTDLVREIHGEITGDSDELTAAVGAEGATTGVPLPSQQMIIRIANRLRRLEAAN